MLITIKQEHRVENECVREARGLTLTTWANVMRRLQGIFDIVQFVVCKYVLIVRILAC